VNPVTINDREGNGKEARMRRGWTVAGVRILMALLVGFAVSPAWAQGRWECPAAEKAKKPPIPANAQNLAAGKKLTADKACTACHGETGKGDGPGAAALNPKPANWTAIPPSESEGCLFWKITTGRGPMPPWGTSLSETERWQLALYVRSLNKK
jgi:mono/diheme cytochrome c family protein